VWNGRTPASVLGAWNGQVGCFPDLAIRTTVAVFLYDDNDDTSTMKDVLLESQFGHATQNQWFLTPTLTPLVNRGGGAYDVELGPYQTDGDFRLRFRVKVWDSEGALAQTAERILLVRACPPVPKPPTIAWVDSGDGVKIKSMNDGGSCNRDLSSTKTVTVQVTDEDTPPEKLTVYLSYLYGDSTGWLEETIAAVSMTHVGNGRYSYTWGPFFGTYDTKVAFYAAVMDGDGGADTTQGKPGTQFASRSVIDLLGCVVIR
jgi:hypothetical protein